jgi:hypothetical protein
MRVARGAAASTLLGLVLLTGCGEPNDTVFVRPAAAPEEIGPGLFRVTWNPAPDVVRGFTPDGARILYQSRDLPGLGAGWYVLSVGVADGAVREEASVYRRALGDPLGQLVITSTHRLLVTWRAVADGVANCPTCPPPPTAVDVAIRRLPLQDGGPLSGLPSRVFVLTNHTAAACSHRVRLDPVEQLVEARRVNPYGPAELADESVGFYSDGDAVWRYDPADPAAPPDSLGLGAFPALSPDGALLAATVPTGMDSTSAFCSVGLCPCVQETVTFTSTGWETLLYDLAAGTVRSLGPGSEPAFDPLAPRVALRRADALYWIELATGTATKIPGTEGGFAPAVAPDGSRLAFSAQTYGNSDVFFVRLR